MTNILHWPRHRLERHEHCDSPGSCPICDGGLAFCTVCHGAEGSMPTDCPGRPMTEEQVALVMSGAIDYRVSQGGWTTWTRDREMAVRRSLT